MLGVAIEVMASVFTLPLNGVINLVADQFIGAPYSNRQVFLTTACLLRVACVSRTACLSW